MRPIFRPAVTSFKDFFPDALCYYIVHRLSTLIFLIINQKLDSDYQKHFRNIAPQLIYNISFFEVRK